MTEVASRAKGETPAHAALKSLCVIWAKENGYPIAKQEVSIPHRGFRVDVGACAPERKAPPRQPEDSISAVLKVAAVFECKQVRSDLIKDNLDREELRNVIRELTARKEALENLLQLHLPHLRVGESLFAEHDSYQFREHSHKGYQMVTTQLRRAKAGLMAATKFHRLLRYGVANLHYLAVEPGIIQLEEIPFGWGLLQRENEKLVLIQKPTWQPIGLVEQLIFLQRIAAAKG